MTFALLTTTSTPAPVPFQEIPLGKLSVWPGNVRRTGAETGLDELAASIRAHGLLNPLTVRATTKGRYEIVAGQRRFLALCRLVADGSLTRKAAISCTVIEAERDAGELSLAENVVRVAMHPADQFTAWQGLAERGASADDIAARFGVTAQTVRRRMALGRVSPALLALYRDSDLSLEALQAFTAPQGHLLDLLAVIAAHGLDAVQAKHDPNHAGRAQGADLAQLLGMDMARWWTPTAASYFGRVPKAVILSDLEAARQAPNAPAWAKLPKKELAALAEREVQGTGWLPEAIR